MNSMIKNARIWADDLWRRAAQKWEEREQDHNYRDYVTRPALKKVIEQLNPVANGVFMDFGCGDGSETRFIAQTMNHNYFDGHIYGFDKQLSLITQAAAITPEYYAIEVPNSDPVNKTITIQYQSCDNIRDAVSEMDLTGKADIVFSTYVLQDLPDVRAHIDTITDALKPYGTAIIMIVHPDFGFAMRKKNAVKVNDRLESDEWEWAGEYPIVERGNRTFYVPYFHRSVGNYLERLIHNFSVDVIHVRLPFGKIIECEEERIFPFYEDEGNVYYPEISIQPSSLIFKAVKE